MYVHIMHMHARTHTHIKWTNFVRAFLWGVGFGFGFGFGFRVFIIIILILIVCFFFFSKLS